MPRSAPARYKQKAGQARWRVGGGSGSEAWHHATSCDIAQWVGRAEQPEGIAEWREMQWCNQRMRQSGGRLDYGVAGTCSGTAEDVAVRRMPRGMLSRPGETLQNVAGWQWKSRQPGDVVKRHAEDGTMVGGSAGDRSGGVRRVWGRKTHQKVEDASGGGRHIRSRKMHRKPEDTSEAGRRVRSRSRVRDGKAWHKGLPLTEIL